MDKDMGTDMVTINPMDGTHKWQVCMQKEEIFKNHQTASLMTPERVNLHFDSMYIAIIKLINN